jgi:murein L,D-transpeptidase YcbB/YkuD
MRRPASKSGYMKRLLCFIFLCLAPAIAKAEPPHWQKDQIARLIEWLDAAKDDGLGPAASEAAKVRDALQTPDTPRLDSVATAAAVSLLRAHLNGCCNASLRTGWHIDNGIALTDPLAPVADAVRLNRLDELFGTARPSHPYYYSLRQAFLRETDPERRKILAANLDRWRWMPRVLGERYLLVNTASFEASLWEGRKGIGRWQVIVGKTGSPTPVFSARVTGVILNPWWEIPSSIVAESVGALVRNRPTEAARRGYVVQDGRYRQRPGAANALGRMKLVMPNPYSVYLHDTPSQSLFERDVRAFSHGCVRVEDALGLATTLLSADSAWNRKRVDGAVAKGVTVKVDIPQPIPVYVTYFTAEPDGNGGIRYFPDIYKRDKGATTSDGSERCMQ